MGDFSTALGLAVWSCPRTQSPSFNGDFPGLRTLWSRSTDEACRRPGRSCIRQLSVPARCSLVLFGQFGQRKVFSSQLPAPSSHRPPNRALLEEEKEFGGESRGSQGAGHGLKGFAL